MGKFEPLQGGESGDHQKRKEKRMERKKISKRDGKKKEDGTLAPLPFR